MATDDKPGVLRLMKEKAEIVQAVVSEIDGLEDAFEYAVDITRKQGGETIAGAGLEDGDQENLKQRTLAAGFSFFESPLRHNADSIHTSVTPVDWGIAETGSLVLNSESEDLRIATMLARTHVAVLRESRIKPDSESLENELNEIMKGGPSYIAFITGASRTADIERVLAIGVHGPKELHILIIKEK